MQVDGVSLIEGELDNIVGRSIVVHAGEDDLGLGGATDSLTTGNAGARVACCKITAFNPKALPRWAYCNPKSKPAIEANVDEGIEA